MAEFNSEHDLLRNAELDPFESATTDPGNATFVRRAHLPVPPPDEDDDDEEVRRPGSGGGNIDPDDEDGSEDDDDEDDDDDALRFIGSVAYQRESQVPVTRAFMVQFAPRGDLRIF